MRPGNNTETSAVTSNSSSACPVAKDSSSEEKKSSVISWASWFQWNKQEKDASSSAPIPPGCPVSSEDGSSKAPASLEEAAAYAQTPHPDQKGVRLSTERMISSIPRGGAEEEGPHHQPPLSNKQQGVACRGADNDPSHWMYPSEQQFFNALRKKGWNDVEAESIPSVLQIHNTINERTWKQVQEWEQNMDVNGDNKGVKTDLKLVRFMGRPNDMSPQAFLWTKILRWADPPFDRHDWYVQKQPRIRTNNDVAGISDYPIQRYVIDYYMFPPPDPDMPPTPYVDARPALDSPRAFYMRAMRLLQEELPGITSEYHAWRANRRSYYDGSLPDTVATSK